MALASDSDLCGVSLCFTKDLQALWADQFWVKTISSSLSVLLRHHPKHSCAPKLSTTEQQVQCRAQDLELQGPMFPQREEDREYRHCLDDGTNNFEYRCRKKDVGKHHVFLGPGTIHNDSGMRPELCDNIKEPLIVSA